MDSYAHCTYTTTTMKKFVEDNKLQDRVIVPVDGELFELQNIFVYVIRDNNYLNLY